MPLETLQCIHANQVKIILFSIRTKIHIMKNNQIRTFKTMYDKYSQTSQFSLKALQYMLQKVQIHYCVLHAKSLKGAQKIDHPLKSMPSEIKNKSRRAL